MHIKLFKSGTDTIFSGSEFHRRMAVGKKEWLNVLNLVVSTLYSLNRN